MTVTKNEKETLQIAHSLGKKIKNGGVVALFGDLGTGKTVFAKGLAKFLKINDFHIKSPTYTYIRKYPLKNRNFYHMDLYRLEKIDELLLHEIEEIMQNKKHIIVIEWADKMAEFLPKKCLKVFLDYKGENKRNIKIVQNDRKRNKKTV